MHKLTFVQAAVVWSGCSHTSAEGGIPIGVDGIRFIIGTAESNLNTEVRKMLSKSVYRMHCKTWSLS